MDARGHRAGRAADGLRASRVPRVRPASRGAAEGRGSRWSTSRTGWRRRSPSRTSRSRSSPRRARTAPCKTNVEYYAAPVLMGVGLTPDLFPATFALARHAGWTAHVIEQARSQPADPAPTCATPARPSGRSPADPRRCPRDARLSAGRRPSARLIARPSASRRPRRPAPSPRSAPPPGPTATPHRNMLHDRDAEREVQRLERRQDAGEAEPEGDQRAPRPRPASGSPRAPPRATIAAWSARRGACRRASPRCG